ncbi:MAG TPA: YfdX family protein, partial [Gammaproteobacteria bacterium]|nr:YfdX family protein [Gammaproteobacteria bacterium]
ELVLAREPSLALAPISLAVFTQDIYATPEMIKNIVSQVRMLIATNDLQKARLLMSNLGSDITLRVTNLPLATYPSAIKLAASLIGQKEFDKAQKTLKTALATLVITTEVIPLPYIRSESLLATIEIYSKEQIDNQVKDKNDRLAAINIMLHAIREELNLAENLGYAKKHEHKPVYKALDSIEKKINKNKPIQDDLFEAKKYLLELISKGV